MKKRRELEKQIAALEAEVKRQKKGFYCHFTSNNVAMLYKRICELMKEVR